ncbi:centromere-associated protein E-like isoform X1 [Zophobas morio]|uniref:centromere-associated protein E-like isoform X1 n=1 Tax=Zophobas morio TaxID=2755281 RepID=UPI003082EAAC
MGGIFSSKVDVAAIEAVEFNVSSLIIRLGEEEVRIDDCVKNRISKALLFYSNVIEKEKRKGYISKHKMRKMNELISQAKSKLNCISTIRRTYENTDGKLPYQMKSELFEIEKQLNTSRIGDEECRNLIYTVITYLQNLEFHSKVTQDQDDNFSLLVLKLFLKSPLVKTVNVLQHTLYNLQGATQHFDILGANSVTVFNAEEVKKHLQEIKEKAETLNQLVQNLEQEVKSKGISPGKQEYHRSNTYASKLANTTPSRLEHEESESGTLVSRYENLLKQVEIDLYEFDTVVDKFCSPIGEAAVENVKRKVLNILDNQLQKVPDKEELKLLKKVLFDKGGQIINKLEKINEENKEINKNLKVLAEVEEKLSTTVESNATFREKQSSLEALIEIVKQIDTRNSEVVLQITGFVNRIEGCLVVESMTFLRSLKKTLDNYKLYVRQFPYPKSVHLYEVKTAEILSLKEHLCNLPSGYRCIDKQVSFLFQQIDEVLGILDTKVKDNEELLFLLQSLDYIANEIHQQNQSRSSGVTKLAAFNNFRKRLNSVDGGTYRVSNKKMQILCGLHVFEENIYMEDYPRDVQNVKKLLNEFEKCVQQLTHSISIEEYDLKRRDIGKLWENAKVVMREKYVSYDFSNVFNENFDLVLKFLKKASKEAQDIKDIIERLELIKNAILAIYNKDLPTTKKLELLAEKEGIIKVLRETSPREVDICTSLENIEKMIALETSRLQLPHCHKLLAKFVQDMSHPMTTDFFKQELNKILHLNERMENMPEDNAELDSLKRSFAKEVFDSLKKLDEFLANLLVKSRKQSENILDLQSHFNDFNLDTNIKRESVEFIQRIHQRAASFESAVKCYLGTNYSVDYYVIHENLMRLLEELDRVSCEDAILINRIVDTVGYIKNLIEELESNASIE